MTELVQQVGGSVRVAVIGGGLAGLAAAVRLADSGRQVQLFESRSRLGGATASFDRAGSGGRPALRVDTGQHVLLRCYHAYLELLGRFGVTDQVDMQDRLDLPVLLPGRRSARLRRSAYLPAPLHLATALVGYHALPPKDRIRAAAVALKLGRIDPDDPATDEQTFGAWLYRHHQSDLAIERLWGLITVAALNIGPDQASLGLAAKVLRTGLLDHRAAGDIGIPRAPLSALHAQPADRLLRSLGAAVHLQERVRQIDPQATRSRSGAASGFRLRTSTRELTFDEVVVAVPHPQAAALVPAQACPQAADWSGLGASPIVNVHLVLDRRVLPMPFAAAPGSSVQWVFDRSEAAGLTRGQYLVTSVSDAGASLPERTDTLRTDQLAALTRLLPKLAEARVLDSFVTREPRATFRQRAGTRMLRPGPATLLPGLALAGAWTATGWPDTMEGAVRSGNAAADLLLGASAAGTDARYRAPGQSVLLEAR